MDLLAQLVDHRCSMGSVTPGSRGSYGNHPIDRRICVLRPRDSDALFRTAEAHRNHLGSHPSGNPPRGCQPALPRLGCAPVSAQSRQSDALRSHSSSGRLAQRDCIGDAEVVRRCVARPGGFARTETSPPRAQRERLRPEGSVDSGGVARFHSGSRRTRRVVASAISDSFGSGCRPLHAHPGDRPLAHSRHRRLRRRWPVDKRWRVIPRPFQAGRPATRSARRSTALPHSGCCLARGWGSTARSWPRR